MDKVRLTLGIALIVLAALTIPALVYYNTTEYQTENTNLKKRVSALEAEMHVLKTANLTAALGVIEEPADPPTSPDDNYYCLLNHLWITGWVFNWGGSMASNPRLNVLAIDTDNQVLMNVTLPIDSYNHFDTVSNESLISKVPRWTHFIPPNELQWGSLFSQENATVTIGIFHEGSFPNSTRYELVPVWDNPA